MPSGATQPAGTGSVQFQGKPSIPLRVVHLKQINLWNRAGDIQQRIDSAELR
jgi:hypothetical protein